MASLEELIYNAITGNASVTALLTTYGTQPAFFEGRSPDDSDQGWSGKQFPRASYILDRVEEPERKVSGRAMIDVYTINDMPNDPEDIEKAIRSALDGAVFHSADEPVTALKWSRSEPFTESSRQDTNDGKVIGITMQFDLLAFPAQTTNEPDPIAALNIWSVDTFNSLQVDPATWAPTNNTPAIYWRMYGLSIASQTNSVTWIDVQLAGHVMAPDTGERLGWIKKITEEIARANRIYLADTSPMFIQRIAADSTADQYREGQIKITARYGILYKQDVYQPLNTAVTSGAIPAEPVTP